MADWPGPIGAVTLFVEDLATCTAFYQRVFDLPVHFSDDDSAVFQFGGVLINLLKVSEAAELVDPARLADPDAGVRMQFTLNVDDVDVAVERLRAMGVELLNGPVDRPWGVRTASFQDPAGHIWELAH
jgi:catechol 2,3-dioxygenase-like lactoylglutathione lyase family enzyme